MSIGSKIKEFADRNFQTVAEFSSAIDTHKTTIYKYFDDEMLPGTPFLKRLHDLGCSLDWLFSDDTDEIKDQEYSKARMQKLERKIYRLEEIVHKYEHYSNNYIEQIEELKKKAKNI